MIATEDQESKTQHGSLMQPHPVEPSLAGGQETTSASTIERDIGGILTSALVPSVAMLGVSAAALIVASTVENGSAWAGTNALAAGLGLDRRWRPSRHFHGGTAVALAALVGGSVGLALVQGAVRRRVGGGLWPGLITGLGGALVDRALLRNGVFRALGRTLGAGGTVALYGALGVASALTSKRASR